MRTAAVIFNRGQKRRGGDQWRGFRFRFGEVEGEACFVKQPLRNGLSLSLSLSLSRILSRREREDEYIAVSSEFEACGSPRPLQHLR